MQKCVIEYVWSALDLQKISSFIYGERVRAFVVPAHVCIITRVFFPSESQHTRLREFINATVWHKNTDPHTRETHLTHTTTQSEAISISDLFVLWPLRRGGVKGVRRPVIYASGMYLYTIQDCKTAKRMWCDIVTNIPDPLNESNVVTWRLFDALDVGSNEMGERQKHTHAETRASTETHIITFVFFLRQGSRWNRIIV